MFADEDGDWIHPERLSRAVKRVGKRVGREDMTVRSLRPLPRFADAPGGAEHRGGEQAAGTFGGEHDGEHLLPRSPGLAERSGGGVRPGHGEGVVRYSGAPTAGYIVSISPPHNVPHGGLGVIVARPSLGARPPTRVWRAWWEGVKSIKEVYRRSSPHRVGLTTPHEEGAALP